MAQLLGKFAATPSPLQPVEGADRAWRRANYVFLSAVVADSGELSTMTGVLDGVFFSGENNQDKFLAALSLTI